MDINTIGIILCIIIIIAVFIQLLRNRKSIVYEKDALISQTETTSSNGLTGTIEQSTYSIWFYVKDWTGNYGIEKCIFKRASSESDFGDLNVSLGATTSDLIIKVKTINPTNYITNYGSYYNNKYPSCGATTLSSTTSNGCTGSTTYGSTGYEETVKKLCDNKSGCNYYSYDLSNFNTVFQLIGTSGSTATAVSTADVSAYKSTNGVWTTGSYYSTLFPQCSPVADGTTGITGCTGNVSYIGTALDYNNLCLTNLGASANCKAYSYTTTYPTTLSYTLLYENEGVSMTTDSPDYISGYGYKNNNYTTCTIPEIELQRWINLVITISTNTMDVYINGELIRSQLLNNIANINASNSVYISPNEIGFNGMNSKFQFWPYYMNPRQVNNVYRQGSGAISTEDVRLNVTLYKGDEKRASLII